ncbi:response regulator receiver protein [Agrobacterium vaccinii]|uniref:phosphorylase family protein n=1 Tax=Agrobacterium vaccinii TaxID=2735528 RepID=UPI001E5749B3|nr:response regulator receiver protein [Agrobacterium vaccinii]UHS55501.1 response regulator receiver protein [Agrobacterium vaccinii]
MRVLVFEDNRDKYDVIKNVLLSKDLSENSIVRAESVAEYVRFLDKNFDLCIIDLRMPSLNGGLSGSAGGEILQMLDYSGKKATPVLAITAFEDEATQYREAFSARGCLIFNFDQKEVWSQALDIFIAQANDRNRYDFIIFAALSEERQPFAEFKELTIKSVTRHGLNLWDCDYEQWSGTVVVLPRMGLVNASATVARVMASYSPRVVAMTGICGGISDRASMGQLLVTDVCFEYQSGKWLGDIHKAEPYQVSITQGTRNILEKLLEDRKLINSLEAGFSGSSRPAKLVEPSFAVFTSGSAVIASAKRLKSVEEQHRKVNAIDMEIFGFHRAVELSGQNVHSFSAKTVVDKADEAKGDDLHEYGSYISARFVLQGIKTVLGDGGG